MTSVSRKPKIVVADRQHALAVPPPLLRAAARCALRYAGPLSGALSIAVVADRQMRDLNLRYAGVLDTTDVLAFDLSDAPPVSDDVAGEVVVNADLALSQARRRRRHPLDELLLYVIHGVLHLCGYRDRTAAQKKKMRLAEAAVSSLLRSQKEYADSCR